MILIWENTPGLFVRKYWHHHEQKWEEREKKFQPDLRYLLRLNEVEREEMPILKGIFVWNFNNIYVLNVDILLYFWFLHKLKEKKKKKLKGIYVK